MPETAGIFVRELTVRETFKTHSKINGTHPLLDSEMWTSNIRVNREIRIIAHKTFLLFWWWEGGGGGEIVSLVYRQTSTKDLTI